MKRALPLLVCLAVTGIGAVLFATGIGWILADPAAENDLGRNDLVVIGGILFSFGLFATLAIALPALRDRHEA
jgi:hypothetical protein